MMLLGVQFTHTFVHCLFVPLPETERSFKHAPITQEFVFA